MVKQFKPKAGEAILALFSKLGGNMNNVLGSRSNITFLGKGKIGEQHHAFFKKHLFDPFSKGIRALNLAKQSVANDLSKLKRAMPDVKKRLKKTVPGTEYTYDQAIRVYLWDKAGYDIPGLTKTDKAKLVEAVESRANIKAFADGVNVISSKTMGYPQPGNNWLVGDITVDMNDALQMARKTFLAEWKQNVEVIFSEKNLNKIEATYGPNFT